MDKITKSLLIVIASLVLLFIIIKSGLIMFNIAKTKPIYSKTSFANLPGWAEDDQRPALLAFQKSCIAINKLKPTAKFAAIANSGTVGAWQTICASASTLHDPDKATARQFFEHWFEPFTVRNYINPYGLFTGYYLPLLQASLKPNSRFNVPIYSLPKDLYKIDLGLFQTELRGKSMIAQLKNGNLYPYPSRAAINSGAIASSARVLFWGDNPVDVFFLQIQGSGIVELPNGKQIGVGYAGDNGHPYTSIGKLLIKRNEITNDKLTMQTIRSWLAQHPEETMKLLNRNASYVFFKILSNVFPLGTEQVPLTPKRSLAVDNDFIPLGAPVWVDTSFLQNSTALQATPFQHLMVAQDTGSTNKGVVRGDIYWGSSREAEFIAGHLKSQGRYWVFFPKSQFLNQPG